MVYKNVSSASIVVDGLERTTSEYILPPWFLLSYLAITLTGGIISNGLLACYLIRRKGFTAVLHLCFTDIASLVCLAPYETFVLANSSAIWSFPRAGCPIFLGLEVLLGTAVVYIIIVINLASVTGHHRSSLKIPLVTIWALVVSLSVPDFILGEVISPRSEYYICCLPKRAAFLVGMFRLLLPVFLLLISTLLLTVSLLRSGQNHSFWLSLSLSLTYIAVSVQRSVLGAMYGVLFPTFGPDAFKTPPLADVVHNPTATLALAVVHYTLSAVRPVISWSFTPEMRSPPTSSPSSEDNQE